MDLRKSEANALLCERVAHLAPALSIGGGGGAGDVDASGGDPAALLRDRGYVTVGRVTRPDCRPLRDAVDAIVADALPGVLVYLFDETWALGETVRRAVSRSLDTEYVLAADAWAWSLAPGRGRGWTAHRGVFDVLLDRARPEVLNVWVALSEASLDRACMSFVALDDDPGYPEALATTDVPPGRAVPLPVPAATVLAWNANVLHWGGECLPTAAGPRTSCSFTLFRRDSSDAALEGVDVGELSPSRRLEIIASQIVVYGDGQPDVSAELRAWAHAAHAFAALRRS